MLQATREAIRGLLKSPGFAAVSILTLALGIGANTAVVSLARAVFYNPLPFKDPDQLVAIAERRTSSRDSNIPVSGHEFAAWKAENKTFDNLALYRAIGLDLTGGGEPEAIQALEVSASFLPVLGLAPALGRGFAGGEDERESRVVILSDRLWRRRFAGDPGVIGRTIALNDQSFTIVGVLRPLPASLIPDLLVPLDVPAQIRAVGRHNLTVIARLRPGATLELARSNITAIAERLAMQMPRDNTGHTVAITPLREDLVG